MTLFGAETGLCVAKPPERTNLAIQAEMPDRSRATRFANSHHGAKIAWA